MDKKIPFRLFQIGMGMLLVAAVAGLLENGSVSATTTCLLEIGIAFLVCDKAIKNRSISFLSIVQVVGVFVILIANIYKLYCLYFSLDNLPSNSYTMLALFCVLLIGNMRDHSKVQGEYEVELSGLKEIES